MPPPPPLPWGPPFVPPLVRRGLPAPPIPSPFDPMNAMMQINRRLGPQRQNNAPTMGLQNIQARVRAQMNAANAVNFPSTALPLLTLVLPGLARLLTSRSNLDLATAVHALMTWHAGTEESSGVPYLSDNDIPLAYETCLSAIRAAGASERLLKHGPRGLITHLETALTTDRSTLRRPERGRNHHSTTLRAFHALAEISRQTSSRFLASLLSEFFHHHHHQRHFWTTHDPSTLTWWIYALSRLYYTPDNTEIDCILQTAVRACPEIIDVLEDYATDAPEVEELYRLAIDVEAALLLRGRGSFRRNSRRRRPRLSRRSWTPDWDQQGEWWRRRVGWGRSSSLMPPPPPRPLTAPPLPEANPRLALQAMKVMEGARKLRRMVGDDDGESDF